MGIENPVHLLFIAIVALVVLGPKRLPELARALGKGVREFREAISTDAPVHAEARVVETPAPAEPAAPGPAAAAPAEPRDPAASSAAESPAAGAG
jgi:sec-independent protein translocase protein TatA